MAQSDADGSWKANAYLVKYELDLYNDFTWFLTDPVDGDQFRQHDNRVYGGAGASRTIDGTLFGRPTETVFGFQSRYDDIGIVLNNTVPAVSSCRTILADHVSEGNAGIFTENDGALDQLAEHDAGLAGDYFDTSVKLDVATNRAKTKWGDRQSEIPDGDRSLLQH